MRMFNRSVSVAALALIALCAWVAWGCQAPAAPTTIIFSQASNQYQGGPGSPGASPSPGAVDRSTIEVYGESCPAGGTARPNPGELKRGCALAITCTPKDSAGNKLPPAIHGPCSWFPLDSQVIRVVPDGGESCNAAAFGASLGSLTVGCSAAAGGRPGALSLLVVP